MNLHVRRQYEMLIRVRDFGSAHRGTIERSPIALQVFEQLNQSITRVERFADEQISRRGEVRKFASTISVTRAALRKRMKAVVVTARGMVREGINVARLEMPESQVALQLVNRARAFADLAESDAAAFIARGMPADFVQRLRQEADAYESAGHFRQSEAVETVGVTFGLAHAVKGGFDLVRQLDGMMLNLFADDAEGLAEWKAARRVDWWQRRTRKKSWTADKTPSSAEKAPAMAEV